MIANTDLYFFLYICMCFSHTRYSGLLFQPSDRRAERHLKVTMTLNMVDAFNYSYT